MDGRMISSAEDVQGTLYRGPDWCRGYLLRRPRQQVSKGGSVKEYVNYVSMTEYGLDCQSRRSKSCVVNDGSWSTESSDWIPKYKQLSYSVYIWGSKKWSKEPRRRARQGPRARTAVSASHKVLQQREHSRADLCCRLCISTAPSLRTTSESKTTQVGGHPAWQASRS